MTGNQVPDEKQEAGRGRWRSGLMLALVLNLLLGALLASSLTRRPVSTKAKTPNRHVEPSGMIVGGPFAPYPMSFPKMTTGIILFEEHPEIAVKPAQAKALLPVLEKLDRDWTILKTSEGAMRYYFNKEQEDYIWAHKSEWETVISTSQREVPRVPGGPNVLPPVTGGPNLPPPVAGGPNPPPVAGGSNAPPVAGGSNAPPVKRSLALNGGNALDSALAVLRSVVKGGDPKAKAVTYQPSSWTVTFYDMTEGIVIMNDIPKLRVKGAQARELLKLVEPGVKASRSTDVDVDALKNLLTDAQLDYIVTHMAEITERRGQIFRESNLQFFVKDPLIAKTVDIVRARAKQAQ
jgi:hypothetical protein